MAEEEIEVSEIEASHIEVSKAEASPDSKTKRLRLGEIGTPFIKAMGGIIEADARRELQFPRCLDTYDEMRRNATISAGLTVNEVFLTKALMNLKIKAGDDKSPKSVEYAKALEWNIKNLQGQTWYDVVTAIITYQQYGFSWLEKVYDKNTSKSFPYKYKIKKLAPRSPKSVKGWLLGEDARDLIGLEQWPQTLLANPYQRYIRDVALGASPVEIGRHKFLLFSWDNKNHNPQGISPLNGCYRAFKELSLIASYEVTGVCKDLSGVLVLRVPTDIINKAAEDPNSDEAKSLQVLQQNAANAHAGNDSSILLGSDTIDGSGSGHRAYDVTLQGVEGGSKSYKTTELIQERKKQILDSLGAGFLNLGNDGVGSYALATGKQSLHAHYMERHLIFIKSVLENDLFKQLAEVNDISLTQDEMPTIEYGALDEPDLDLISKSLHRLGSSNLIPKTKEFLLPIYESMGLDITSLKDMSEEEFKDALGLTEEEPSAGSDTNLSSGTGKTQEGGLGSDLNNENTA